MLESLFNTVGGLKFLRTLTLKNSFERVLLYSAANVQVSPKTMFDKNMILNSHENSLILHQITHFL